MKQPDLGKKLADIRKLKGLTQEELVAKCNVTVRTIQRIEAGEVTPTLRLIVEALEYDWNNFSGDENPDSSHVDKTQVHWLERIFPFTAPISKTTG
jgi:transcriptional regulator with XRE-family HTH domain